MRLVVSVYYFLANGVYQFETYMMGSTTRGSHEFAIMKNGADICRGFIGIQYLYRTSFCVTTIEMQTGDQVYVEASGFFKGKYYSGFSGFQIKAL